MSFNRIVNSRVEILPAGRGKTVYQKKGTCVEPGREGKENR
jgi:hypothetical protein